MWNTLSRMARTGLLTEPLPVLESGSDGASLEMDGLRGELLAILGRALCIRHVDAGSCNGCELEIQALHNPYYNLEGAGIHFVAKSRATPTCCWSPAPSRSTWKRHCDAPTMLCRRPNW